MTLRIFAGFIDLLQFVFFVVFLAFQVMTPYGGAAIGGVAGAYVCWSMSDGIVNGIVNGAACALGIGAVGGIVSAIATPVGMAIDVAISATFGTLLLLCMWVTGRFYLMPVALGFSGELLPGINAFVPGWSLLVHRCIQQHKLQEQGVGRVGRTISLLGSMGSVVPGAAVATKALKPALAVAGMAQRAIAPRDSLTRTPLKNFDGIKASNDNALRNTYAKAA